MFGLLKNARKNLLVFSAALYSSLTFAQHKLAIVIDDVGYHPKQDAAILAMPREISVAIIRGARPRSLCARARYFDSYADATREFDKN